MYFPEVNHNFRWGTKTERIDVTLNVEQANYTRDAWVKALHARLFDYLVAAVNDAIEVAEGQDTGLSIGILDIYGFEIFENNGFEQFCTLTGRIHQQFSGIMCILDDVCAQNHGQSEGVDAQLLSSLNKTFVQHPHYQSGAECFLVKHYAGDVS
ncbi:hypothetical protein COOONC_04321, partial [Cooperia oncophora]